MIKKTQMFFELQKYFRKQCTIKISIINITSKKYSICLGEEKVSFIIFTLSFKISGFNKTKSQLFKEINKIDKSEK